MDGWIGRWVGGWEDGWTDGWIGGWMDGWMMERDSEELFHAFLSNHPTTFLSFTRPCTYLVTNLRNILSYESQS
jgi:hypothetical protein